MKYFTIFATLLLTGSVCHAGIIEYKAGKEFAPVSMENVAVKAGSALDLSGNIDAPAGKYGRLLPSSDGTIVTEKDPKRKIRLSGGMVCPKPCGMTVQMRSSGAMQLFSLPHSAVKDTMPTVCTALIKSS